MKRIVSLVSLLAFVSLVGYIGFPAGDLAAGQGCKTMAGCSKMQKPCADDCCCKKTDGACCEKDDCCKKCSCCSENGCCTKMDKPCCNKPGAKDADASTTTDPVCGMSISADDAKYSSEYDGKTYYFCNEFCKKKFDKDPSGYLGE